jgi:hypothetical protein
MRRQWCHLKTASARPARLTRVQATAVRPLVEDSSLQTVASAHRERRVPGRATARRMGTQPMCHRIAVPAPRALPVPVLAIVGADNDLVSL